jgi:hypothetical protein
MRGQADLAGAANDNSGTLRVIQQSTHTPSKEITMTIYISSG